MSHSELASGSGPRVLHVVGYLHGNDGITTHLLSLTEGLLRHGGAVGVASCVNADPAYHIQGRGMEKFRALGAQYFYVPFPDAQRPDRQRLDGVRAVKRLYDAVSAFRPDVLHLHSLSLFPYAWAVRLLAGVPIVSTTHLDLNPHRTGVKALRGLNAVSTVLPDALVALSGDQEEQFRTALRVPDSRIRRIPHGIDADYFRPPTPAERETARRKFGLRPGTPTVCMIGRLDYLKGHDVLIRALARLRDRAVPVHTLLAGTGASEPNIRTLIEDEGLTETVHLLGFADSRDVLWASEVSVLPSRQEIFGLVAVESMLCGVVPVRTPCAGASEQIVDGSTGFIIPFDDDQALADRLALLLTEPARRAEMAQGALRHARTHFTSETMIDRTLSLYAEMAGRPPTLAAPLPTPAVSPSEHLGTPASSSL